MKNLKICFCIYSPLKKNLNFKKFFLFKNIKILNKNITDHKKYIYENKISKY